MNDYSALKDKIENIFTELNITYKTLDLEDEDLNYLISFNTYGELKLINAISGVMYFHHSDFSMNFLVLNIYNLDDDNDDIDTLDLYEVINDVNVDLLYGSFLVEDNKRIYYRNSMNCGLDYSGLDIQLVKRQIDAFLGGLVKLFYVIRKKEEIDE